MLYHLIFTKVPGIVISVFYLQLACEETKINFLLIYI